MKAYIRTYAKRAPRPGYSSPEFDCLLTQEVPCKAAPMPAHRLGLSGGYGARIPTQYMVQVDNRWRRVYCRIYSNAGTLFIGKTYDGTVRVDIDNA